ncbi:MAG: hypothetical protein LBI28_15025 [Treponema sp.]|jgi:hypothetical protein|nr:hypothetical protein [Treponema sp.]
MADYSSVQKEETLKAQVFRDFFNKSKYAYEPDTGNIDFIVTDTKLQKDSIFKHHYLWAEAKKGVQDVPIMLTQLVLTIKKTYDKGDQLPPPYIGCFDTKKIAFVPFHDILPIFHESDFNWNITPSNHETDDFQKAKKKIAKLILKNLAIYHFYDDKNEIVDFINNNLVPGALNAKSQITKNNFAHIYNKWVKEVKPFINIPKDEWNELRNAGILDCDFYRADMMSSEGDTITEKLKIILEKDNYKLKESIKGRLFSTTIDFSDGGVAYRQFWNKYERPPAQEYQQYIIDRRDLLVPQNIREIKGSFFTPAIWVEKSQEYLEAVFGKNWQDEYVVWDCAAGTGNLLAGLVNKYNLWASTIDQPDVDTMHALIDDGFNLLHDQVFQFDFLNDSFDKLPKVLKDIIDDPEKRKKLIIYINPPYAEAANHGNRMNKAQVTSIHRTSEKYKLTLGRGINELFANFFVRIYHEIPDTHLASFSTLKYINSQNFIKFREYFLAEFKAGFICPANTFDNVNGKFPVGFLIWDLSRKKSISKITTEVFDYNDKLLQYIKQEKKSFYATNTKTFIIDWLRTFFDDSLDILGFMRIQGVDFQQNNTIFITSKPSEADIRESKITKITKNNLIEMCIYLTIRQCIEATWLNNRDQFLLPKESYKNDNMFHYDCLIFSLFHSQNHIESIHGTNHWIPFTEKEVNAKTKFQSNFMSDFLKEKTFSPEAQEVLNSGRELWSYYHTKIANNRTATVDASFYDIREFFQGRSEKGTMKQKSDDETYNTLIKSLRQNLSVLAEKIKPKVYEYGFLVE